MPEPEEQSTRPAVSPVFRESFLSYFERPEHEAALRLMAEVADTLVSEGRDYLDMKGIGTWHQLIRGAVGDLRQAADQLAEVARDLDQAASGGREVARAMLAIADATTEVEPIAARLDAALAHYLTASAEVGHD